MSKTKIISVKDTVKLHKDKVIVGRVPIFYQVFINEFYNRNTSKVSVKLLNKYVSSLAELDNTNARITWGVPMLVKDIPIVFTDTDKIAIKL